MANRIPVTVVHGDGTEIMAPTTGTAPKDLFALLGRVIGLGLDIAMTESRRKYDGKPGFTLAQGQ